MNSSLIRCLVLLALGLMPVAAQTATPARPVDPDQGMPAQPVDPNGPPVPVAAPQPATPVSDTPEPPKQPAKRALPVTNEVAKPARPAVPVQPAPTPKPLAPLPAPTAVPDQAPLSLSIIADSSLRDVLIELAQSWADSQDADPQVPLTLTNAGTLRAKVDAGSTWDLVIGADLDEVKQMTQKGLLMSDSQRSLARNTLVLYGRKALIKDDELEWFDLIGTEWKRVAMGNPDLVESGRVAQRALKKHDLFDDDHKKNWIMKPSEALAIATVQSEQADAVFAYKTDLVGVNLPSFVPLPLKTEDAPPIFYTVAICRLSKNPQLAKSFIEYCASDAAKPIWAKHGYETN